MTKPQDVHQTELRGEQASGTDAGAETPLVELLREIPELGRVEEVTDRFEDGTPCGHRLHPAGFLAHKAANKIDHLASQVKRLESALEECRNELLGADQHVPSDSWKHGIQQAIVQAEEALGVK